MNETARLLEEMVEIQHAQNMVLFRLTASQLSLLILKSLGYCPPSKLKKAEEEDRNARDEFVENQQKLLKLHQKLAQ